MGILYLVPTPVGNMEDMTLRAIRILKEADLVLCEDTRTSGILLKHFEIKNHLMSHHKFNEHSTSAGIVNRLKAGKLLRSFRMLVRLESVTLASFLHVKRLPMVSLFKLFQGLLPLFQHWFQVVFHVIVSALKASCHRRKDVKHSWKVW